MRTLAQTRALPRAHTLSRSQAGDGSPPGLRGLLLRARTRWWGRGASGGKGRSGGGGGKGRGGGGCPCQEVWGARARSQGGLLARARSGGKARGALAFHAPTRESGWSVFLKIRPVPVVVLYGWGVGDFLKGTYFSWEILALLPPPTAPRASSQRLTGNTFEAELLYFRQFGLKIGHVTPGCQDGPALRWS